MVAGTQQHISIIYREVSLVPFSMCLTYFTLAYAFLVTQKSIIRATAAAIEFFLTFIRFIMSYRIQRIFGGGIRDGVSNMQTSTHLLYVFYRDGILLAIP